MNTSLIIPILKTITDDMCDLILSLGDTHPDVALHLVNKMGTDLVYIKMLLEREKEHAKDAQE